MTLICKNGTYELLESVTNASIVCGNLPPIDRPDEMLAFATAVQNAEATKDTELARAIMFKYQQSVKPAEKT